MRLEAHLNMPKKLLETFIKDGKTYAKIDDLTLWENNPTIILEQSYKDLRAIIEKRGQNLPIITNSGKKWGVAGTVPNGNTRLRIYREMGITEVWVSVVDAESEFDLIQLSLEHNVRYGATDPDKLAQMLMEYKDSPELAKLKVIMSAPSDISNLLKFYGPSDGDKTPATPPETQEVSFNAIVNGLKHECPKCGFKF